MKRTICAVFAICLAPMALAQEVPSDEDTPLLVSSLIKQLAARSKPVRLEAARELGRLGAAAEIALPALTKIADDPDMSLDVRRVAHEALATIRADVASKGYLLMKEEKIQRDGQLRERTKRSWLEMNEIEALEWRRKQVAEWKYLESPDRKRDKK